MVERVIVAVDGGPASAAALSWVIERARTVEVAVEITTVAGIGTGFPLGAEGDFRAIHDQIVADAADSVRTAAPDLVVSTRVRFGLPHEAIVRASQNADLLVIGTNKTSPAAGIIHGTLPLKVAGRAGCVTVVVPAAWGHALGPVIAGWSDDETAERALDFAADEAGRRDVPLTIVHSWAPPSISAMDDLRPLDTLEQLFAADRRRLNESAQRVRDDHPGLVVTCTMLSGSAAVAIVRAAAGASLVVVGSRGRGAIAELFLGSVSHDVLLNMPAPVAVVPAQHTAVESVAIFGDDW